MKIISHFTFTISHLLRMGGTAMGAHTVFSATDGSLQVLVSTRLVPLKIVYHKIFGKSRAF